MSGTRTGPCPTELRLLLGRAAAGDGASFARLYDLTCDLVWRLELCRHRDPVAAEEAVRRRYAAAWRHAAAQPRSGRSPQAWLLSLDPAAAS
ncbi:hypothetical protein [Pimelobacter sp. 30-1]|uniref:hypothetical protein n=1 Tax=Pimelobacter sp. 30-1 TaxID=2004991 RepID=UPI001C0520A8|nr:hypothetical protein [Pimelobacter sp. 30-1]MBU2695694.1 hypothetical protein [Pimelobacter sp. 30-1]